MFPIVFLNGPTSAGKTTLAKALQKTLLRNFLRVGIDDFLSWMPERCNDWEGKGHSVDGFYWKEERDPEGHLMQTLYSGAYGKKVSQAFLTMIEALAATGLPLIIEDVVLDQPNLEQWKEALKKYAVLWVGLGAPLEVLETREIQRGNRRIGSARAQHKKVHEQASYDLFFNVSEVPLEVILATLVAKIES